MALGGEGEYLMKQKNLMSAQILGGALMVKDILIIQYMCSIILTLSSVSKSIEAHMCIS